MTPEVIHSKDIVPDSTRLILDSARAAIAERGVFRIALSGGNTPKPIYKLWAETAGADFPWDKVQITYGDERCVPPDDEQSNYRMSKLSLLDHAPIPEGNVFRMRGELPPDEAAAEYEKLLEAVAARFGEKRYRHDLLLLGMGPDGHTASLFPGTEALTEQTRNVVQNFVPKFDTFRITFTYPLLNAARHVVFLVAGEDKKSVVEEILAGSKDYPAGHVIPTDGKVTWMLSF